MRRTRPPDLTFVRELVDERYPDIGADYFDEYMEWRDEEEAGEERQDAYEADPFVGDDPFEEEQKSAEADPFGGADPFEGIEGTGPADGAEGGDVARDGAGER
ncbi:hypothetical protein ACFV2B_40420 [Streptomyces lavendulae]|uniref:hypothetical protein n=1 Tax=Streptomyces lavendulae TaxID=1914 RepID=UPI00369F96A6